jgi:lipopolysaccharide transport system permease protein
MEYQHYFFMNPMALLIDSYRIVLMEAQQPDWNRLMIVGAVGVFGCVIATALIKRLDYVYPRILQP